MKKIIYSTALLVSLFLVSCGTQKNANNAVTTDNAIVQKEIIVDSNANSQFISVKEAAEIAMNADNLPTIAKKYGYKMLAPYSIYRLDKYDKMLYKNCRLTKKMSKDTYEDTPLPMAKGTSSYVAINEAGVTIGVFNNAAYDNLVDQVKNGGFELIIEGYEDHYSNGSIEVYCYKPRRTVRITKQ